MTSLRAKRFSVAAVIVAALVGWFTGGWIMTRHQPETMPAFARPASAYEAPPSFAPVARALIPAVVNVDTTAYKRVTSFRDMFEGRPYSVVPEQGRASGFVVRSDGYILTNQHVVAGAQEITVTFKDGKRFKAKVAGQDQVLDLAVLKVDANGLPAVSLGDSSAIEPGDWAIAIGNPFGFDHTVTVGVISALGRPIAMGDSGRYYQDLIQTDAYINQGNSGGPLLNAKGEVIGINAMIFAAGSVPAPIGFAIPINLAKTVLQQVVKYGKVVRSLIGVRLEGGINPYQVQRYGIPEDHGVVVGAVASDSPAAKAGLARGDIIISLQKKPVRDTSETAYVVRSVPVGQPISVELLRYSENKGWQRISTTVKTIEAPANVAPDVT